MTDSQTSAPAGNAPSGFAPTGLPAHPFRALWALCLGFFMILIDTTIVSVATPSIMTHLNASINQVIWVTSAYLLAYAVPLLFTGRLGDQIGPKAVYQTGLVVFTLSSAWCGLSTSITMLIIARVFQGLGAAMMTPQTMAVITRTFPPNKRGVALSIWGAVAGVAMLVGPILGGVLVDSLGWEWIFFVNVPVGIVGLILAMRFVPHLPAHSHRWDVLGIALSGIGMFLLVFGIQEGQTYNWGTIAGPISVWLLIILGLVVLAAFLVWEAKTTAEPLLPLALFRDRNFSLANVGISTVGFAVTAMALPLFLYTQKVLGLSPTRSALLLIPMALLAGVLARPVGVLVDRVHPRYLAGFGLLCMIIALVWLSVVMKPGQTIIQLELPITLMGVANGFIWSPLAATATRNLPVMQAGAGAGVYNTTRQVGAVLGSASIAVLMESRLAHNLPPLPPGTGTADETGPLPPFLHDAFATSMAQSVLLPAAVLVIGFVAAVFFARPAGLGQPASWASASGADGDSGDESATTTNRQAASPAAPEAEPVG
jgi:EmrB/QacA subfamily drug resistance transporter